MNSVLHGKGQGAAGHTAIRGAVWTVRFTVIRYIDEWRNILYYHKLQ